MAAMDFVKQEGERVFDGGQAGGGTAVAGRIGFLLFFESVGGVIGGDDLNSAVVQRLPETAIVVSRF